MPGRILDIGPWSQSQNNWRSWRTRIDTCDSRHTSPGLALYKRDCEIRRETGCGPAGGRIAHPGIRCQQWTYRVLRGAAKGGSATHERRHILIYTFEPFHSLSTFNNICSCLRALSRNSQVELIWPLRSVLHIHVLYRWLKGLVYANKILTYYYRYVTCYCFFRTHTT